MTGIAPAQNPKEKDQAFNVVLDRLIDKVNHCREYHNISDQEIYEVRVNPHRDK
ncbi:MAG: hypothetical protein ACMUEM_07560 [Flavobacteriales bacterium AspAUS03]